MYMYKVILTDDISITGTNISKEKKGQGQRSKVKVKGITLFYRNVSCMHHDCELM